MNTAEAKDAIKFWESGSLHKSLDLMAKMLHAKGYLEALQGEEVKGLIEAAELGLSYLESDYVGSGGKDLTNGAIAKIKETLSQFKDSTKP